MIRTEAEYKQALARVRAEEARFRNYVSELKKEGLKADEMKRLLDPIQSFFLQLKEEVDCYERLKRGDFEAFNDLNGLGRLLIAARIARGFTQRKLAEELGVSETSVSRDERNEYHGITIDRANRILEVLGVDLHCEPELAQRPHKARKTLVHA